MAVTTILTDHAAKRGAYMITAEFTDEDGAAVIPTSLKWHLSKTDGTILNSRQNVAVAVPAASVTVLLKDNDLFIDTTDEEWVEVFTIDGFYTSLVHGAGIPVHARAKFIVENLVAIPSSSSSSSSSTGP